MLPFNPLLISCSLWTTVCCRHKLTGQLPPSPPAPLTNQPVKLRILLRKLIRRLDRMVISYSNRPTIVRGCVFGGSVGDVPVGGGGGVIYTSVSLI